MALLTVDNLTIQYRTARGCLTAVDQASFSLPRGQCFGLVGESGCGKTTIGTAIMGLLPDNAQITSGRIALEGENLLTLPDNRMRHTRWRKLSMIFQAAMNALNPIQRVEDQIVEAIQTHLPDLSKAETARRVAELFSQVGIPENRCRDYPHQYSGGMRQRAVIAMALACRPALVIADEPTTALDVIVQDQILSLLRGLQQSSDMSILLISHDISVVADVCDTIAVLYGGQIVEMGSRREVFETPAHPYTRALLDAHITLAGHRGEPKALQGAGPDLISRPDACLFCDRCPVNEPNCRQAVLKRKRLSDTHHVLCCKE